MWEELVVQSYHNGAGNVQASTACEGSTPVACRLVNEHITAKHLATFRGCQVKYSVMSMDAAVMPHTGLTDARLRLHIPLSVPVEAAGVEWWIRVGNPALPNAARQWMEGVPLLIDDSFEHEVWTVPTDNRHGHEEEGGECIDGGGDECMENAAAVASGSVRGKRRHTKRIILIVDLWHPDLDDAEKARLLMLPSLQ